MNLGKLLLLFVVGLLLVGSAFAFTNDVDTLGVVVTPFDDDGSVSFLTDFSYRFDFTNALNCSGVLLSLDESVTTNAYGWSGLDLNISSLDVMTSYVCEYIDGDLNAVRELNPNLFDADTIDTLGCSENQTILYDGGDWVCANSSDWVETAGDSMTGDLYMNANSLTNVSTFNFNVPSSELNLSSTLFASFYPLMALKSAGMGVGGLSDVAGLMNVIGGVDMGGLVSLKDDDAFQTMLLGAYDNAYPLVEDVRTLMAIFNLSDSPAELLSSGLTMRTNFSRYDAGFFVSDSIYTDGDELFYTYYDGGKILSLNDEHDALLPRISWGDGNDTVIDISNSDLNLTSGDIFGVGDLTVSDLASVDELYIASAPVACSVANSFMTRFEGNSSTCSSVDADALDYGNITVSGSINQTIADGNTRYFSNGCYEKVNSTGVYFIC